MNITYVNIIVFPKETNLNQVEDYDELLYGRAFSNLNEIQVNRVPNGFSVLYRDDIFSKLDPTMFVDGLINLLTSNISDTFVLKIYYFYMGSHFYHQCGSAIISMDEYLSNHYRNDMMRYTTSESVSYIIDHYDAVMDRFYIDDSNQEEPKKEVEEYDDDDIEDEDSEDDEEEEDTDDDEEEFDIEELLKPSKNTNKSYDYSRIMRTSKDTKRNVKRHGIIISSNKDARKRDVKILSGFLKDFIPGKSRWIKTYREEILERWMDMYVITKKIAKRMSKEHKDRLKRTQRRKPPITKDGVINFTQKLLQNYSDPFYDPNR